MTSAFAPFGWATPSTVMMEGGILVLCTEVRSQFSSLSQIKEKKMDTTGNESHSHSHHCFLIAGHYSGACLWTRFCSAVVNSGLRNNVVTDQNFLCDIVSSEIQFIGLNWCPQNTCNSIKSSSSELAQGLLTKSLIARPDFTKTTINIYWHKWKRLICVDNWRILFCFLGM